MPNETTYSGYSGKGSAGEPDAHLREDALKTLKAKHTVLSRVPAGVSRYQDIQNYLTQQHSDYVPRGRPSRDEPK